MAQVSLIDLPSKEPETIEVENASQNTPPPSWEAIINSFSDKELATIRRKLDIRLVVPLGCMYCVSVMDRNNLGFAAITGMVTDLNLVGNRYNLIVLWFFITYVLVQPVATACLRKATPPIFIPTITLIWGMLLIGFGFVERWYQLLPLRVILGLLEGGLLPSAVYLMSCWYVRHELQKRNGLFYALGIFASAFSGILSYGFAQMEGLGGGPEYLGRHVPPPEDDPGAATVIRPGIAGWRWIFIMQGVLTCIVACLGYVLVIDFPEVAAKRRYLIRFLQPREIEFMIARLEQDRDDVRPEKFSVIGYLKNGLDLKIWGFCLLAFLSVGPVYSVALFLPIILRDDMEFNVAQALCLNAPPQIAAIIVIMVSAHFSDKWKLRAPFIIFNGCIVMIGCGLLGWTSNIGVRYFGAFLIAIGVNANVPAYLTWMANNIRGQWKRAFASALNVAMAGIGGIMGGTVFRGQDAPRYIPGVIACMICGALIVLTASAMALYFRHQNAKADEGKVVIEGLEGFRYTL